MSVDRPPTAAQWMSIVAGVRRRADDGGPQVTWGATVVSSGVSRRAVSQLRRRRSPSWSVRARSWRQTRQALGAAPVGPGFAQQRECPAAVGPWPRPAPRDAGGAVARRGRAARSGGAVVGGLGGGRPRRAWLGEKLGRNGAPAGVVELPDGRRRSALASVRSESARFSASSLGFHAPQTHFRRSARVYQRVPFGTPATRSVHQLPLTAPRHAAASTASTVTVVATARKHFR